MKRDLSKSLTALVCLIVILTSGMTAWALDEAVLTPTRGNARPVEDKAFDAAMNVWFSHKYADGNKLLKDFAKKHPNNRWRAEAELHEGCYLTYIGQTAEAKPLFQRLASEFADTNIKTKAQLRLANIAEREARTDDAIKQFAAVLRGKPTWDQFKYANYHARKLMMTRGQQEARINCGPVALAACLDAIGRKSEADTARSIKPTTDGTSLGVLEAQCAIYGVPAKSVEMTLDELKKTALPVLAYVEPKHFIAIMGIKETKAYVQDSIRGGYETSLEELSQIWAGKVLTFSPTDKMKPLTLVASLETTGGCCGQIDEEECLGDPCGCSQTGSGPGKGGGGGGCGFGPGETPTIGSAYGPGCVDKITDPDWSPGRPRWQVNVDNLNILVKDTPVFYTPGKGPKILFTLTYSNENSNTGIFGRGWRCQYDMKVFFLPSYYTEPTLQVHRDNGRIETYVWNETAQKYEPRSNYGYRDTIEKLADGTVVLSLRSGAKYYFMPEGGIAEGRIHYIDDPLGNRVTCSYDSSGCLSSVTDANGGVTSIVTDGTGINERVTFVRIPRFVSGQWVPWSSTDPDARQAEFRYTDGNLIYIKDMLGDASTLSYNALLTLNYTSQFSASTTAGEAVTASSPATSNGTLTVASTAGFLPIGKIRVNSGEEMSYTSMTATSFTGITRTNPVEAYLGCSVEQVVPNTYLSSDITSTSPATGGQLDVLSTAGFPSSGYIAVEVAGVTEAINYTGKTATAFTGITRGEPAYDASAAAGQVWLCTQTPYLSEIVTPSKKTQFSYRWSDYSMQGGVVWLHEVRECGPTESYPALPTIDYAWQPYQTTETKFPAQEDMTGGLSKIYGFGAFYDATDFITDELGNYVARYEYNSYRDRTSTTDANGKTMYYSFVNPTLGYEDGKHNMYKRTDPLGTEWTYTYNDNHTLHSETDGYGRLAKTYTYDAAGQLTQIDTPIGTQVTNHYDTLGRMDYSTDARGKTTHYYYDGDPRGLLTSVVDPEGKTTTYHYDASGRKDQVTDPSGNVTKYEYDDLDRVTKTILGSALDAPYTKTEYTCCHKVYDQDENLRRTYYVYDTKVRPYKTITSSASTTLATGITTTLPANGGNLAVTSVQDLLNEGKVVVLDEIISYTGIDAQNNLLTGITRGADGTRCVEVDSGFAVGRVDTVQATFGYHPQYWDRMISLTDAMNHTTYYTYYLNGKQETIRYPDDKGERYTYDGNGSGPNMIKKEYGTFSGPYASQTFTPSNDLTVNYEYDANNRLLRSYH